MTNQVSRDVAEEEFARFIDSNDIDLRADDLSAQDTNDTKAVQESVIRYIERGIVSIDPQGMPVIHTRHEGDLKFKEPTGMVYTAMDSRKKDHEYAKMFASLAQITGTSIATFNRLRNPEVKAALSVWGLFLAQ